MKRSSRVEPLSRTDFLSRVERKKGGVKWSRICCQWNVDLVDMGLGDGCVWFVGFVPSLERWNGGAEA